LAVRELCRLLEFCARLSGELQNGAQHNELHVHVSETTALSIAQTFLRRHAPALPVIDAPVAFPQQGKALPEAISNQVDSSDCTATVRENERKSDAAK
jgi:hypothetical protein